ncbi:hypothetical protein WM28_25015 [Burkholderia ubonensis]|nr:hypothetical protein WM28_25015 [Burkholderia ubonensis]
MCVVEAAAAETVDLVLPDRAVTDDVSIAAGTRVYDIGDDRVPCVFILATGGTLHIRLQNRIGLTEPAEPT